MVVGKGGRGLGRVGGVEILSGMFQVSHRALGGIGGSCLPNQTDFTLS